MSISFGLVIVGDEILSGKRADKHLPKVIELLAARGLQLAYADYVGDDPARITAALARAFAAARTPATWCFPAAASAPRRTTTRASAPPRRWAWTWRCIRRPKRLIRERMQDVAREQGVPYEPDRPDNIHRLNMGVFPEGAAIIPNPYNKIPGFRVQAGAGAVHFVPGFPVMAWPMIEWVLDTHYGHLHQKSAYRKSVIVMGSMEAALTPLMEAIEAGHRGVKVFSLPSVDHPEYGRHIDLGVKGAPEAVNAAFPALLAGLHSFNAKLGPELVR